jgi:hypothetical protein
MQAMREVKRLLVHEELGTQMWLKTSDNSVKRIPSYLTFQTSKPQITEDYVSTAESYIDMRHHVFSAEPLMKGAVL